MSTFRFVSYGFENGTARFEYRDDSRAYVEQVIFPFADTNYNAELLDKALFLAFLLAGTSYYKASAAKQIVFEGDATLDTWQADFCNLVYQEGLSQFAFENNLTRDGLPTFLAVAKDNAKPCAYAGDGILSLQSGGKDSLLVATLLEKQGTEYTPWYASSMGAYPALLESLAAPVQVAKRIIDRDALKAAAQNGGLNGHVPVTYILMSYAVIQAILNGQNTVLTAIAHEGDEAHAWIGDLPVNHQWSKTWQAEQKFTEYVRRYISSDIRVGSPLRGMSELAVAQKFADNAWERFGDQFSSCNVANYGQGVNNAELTWCGNCPKCVNSYLLFSPFIAPDILQKRFGGDLYARRELSETFKGLLGIDGVMKPFECVGEVDELRCAYHLSQKNSYGVLPSDVPVSDFSISTKYDLQDWAAQVIQI